MTTERQPGDDALFSTSPIEKVREGMHVVDSAGNKLGTVAYIRLGDPSAATTAGNEPGSGSGVKTIPDVVAEGLGAKTPDVPEPLRSQLIRQGFIMIDSPGLGGHDRYVRSDKIRAVSGDTVILSAAGEQAAIKD